jgi:hypothetical protein
MAICACTLGRVATSGGDGMDSCTRVPTALSCQAVKSATSRDPSTWENLCGTGSSWTERLDARSYPGSRTKAGRAGKW